MPIYEYECRKCGHINSFIEPVGGGSFFRKIMRKCESCHSRKLHRIFSSFNAKSSLSYADSLNELSSMGNVNFTPQSMPPGGIHGPPPGGCPYAQKNDKNDKGKGE